MKELEKKKKEEERKHLAKGKQARLTMVNYKQTSGDLKTRMTIVL